MKPRTPRTLESPKPARAARTPPKPVARTTAQQSADFTAEGAPPPGLVGTEVPEDAGKAPHGAHHKDAPPQ